ncbi:MAG TPA: MmgE/PrpD family protein [Methylomirabilota bacterium]|nr:MmgE/PrpD family protein [Methylomirabilota bacterium]
MGPTEILAKFVIDTRLGDIPQQAIKTSKLVILDALGVTLAASLHPTARIITQYVRDAGAAPRAGVIGTYLRTEPSLAALANGTMAFILDYDDDLHGSTHTITAALGVGEELRATGEKFLEAYILGREVCFRLDAALDAGRKTNRGGPTSRGWFAGGTTGSLAAAAAAGKVVGLNARQMATAFGIAASSAGGLRRNFGTMAKALQTGSAARNGVTAALLAKRGFSADQTILEAPFGLADALCLEGECDWSALTKGLGESFYMERLPTIKTYPTCSPAHRPIEALLLLRQNHAFTPDNVVSVECDFHVRSLCRVDPEEAMAGHNSMPFILAMALIDGRVAVEQFTDDRVHDPQVRSVMSKIRHVPSVRQNGQTDVPDRVTVTLKNGAVHSAEVAERRTLKTKSEIVAKYMDCATRALDRKRAELLSKLVDQLETVPEVSALMSLMSGDHFTFS